MMTLAKRFPELAHRTIWLQMPGWAAAVVFKTMAHEQEFGRPLPDNSYFKALAIKVVRRAQKHFKELAA